MANTCCWPQLRRLPSPPSTLLLKASPLFPTMVRPLPSQKSENAAHPYKPASTGSPSLTPVTTRRSPTRLSHPPPPKTWSITPICSVETRTNQPGLAPCGRLSSLLALPPPLRLRTQTQSAGPLPFVQVQIGVSPSSIQQSATAAPTERDGLDPFPCV